MRIVGFQLLAKIKLLNKGSYDLLNFDGNIRSVLVECEYIQNTNSYTEKVSKRALRSFSYEYWKALQENDIFQTKGSVHTQSGKITGRLKKKFKHILTPAEKEEKEKKAKARELYRQKNPPIKQGKVITYTDPNITTKKSETEELTRSDYKLNKQVYERISGIKLLNEVIKLKKIGKKETSICIITGYEVSNIGVFRRQFAKAAGVKLAPLGLMIKEMREKDFLIEPPKEKETQKTLENAEEQEVFVNREKITSQVKRLYRNPKFREKILKQHGSTCSCCDIAMEKLIEAAHIIPVEDNGNDDVKNGIPLCPTHHTAFDNFLFTINPTDNAIIYKEGLTSEDLQITKTECKLNVSKESLEYRFKLFNE